jgi:hypothetical protein
VVLRAEIEIARRSCGGGRQNRSERHAWLRNRWKMAAAVEARKAELGDRYILKRGRNGTIGKGSADKWDNWRDNPSGPV